MRMKKVSWQWFFVFVLMFLSILSLGVIAFAGLQAKELLEGEVYRRNRTLTYQIPPDIEKYLYNWLKGSLDNTLKTYSSSKKFTEFAREALKDPAIFSIHLADLRNNTLHSANRKNLLKGEMKQTELASPANQNLGDLLASIIENTAQASDTLEKDIPLDLKPIQGEGGALGEQQENFALRYFPLVKNGIIEGYLSLVLDTQFLIRLIRAYNPRYPSVILEITGLGSPFILTETGYREGSVPVEQSDKLYSIGPVSLSEYLKRAKIKVYFPAKWTEGGSSSFESFRVRFFLARYENLTGFILAPFCLAIIGLILLYSKMHQAQTRVRIQNDWIENIAHDLQTPIHAIGSVLDLMTTNKDSLDSNNLMKLIRLELARMVVSTRVFMQLARGMDSSTVLPRVDKKLGELVEEALETIRLIHMGKEPQFEIDPTSMETPIRVEPGSFRDMLVNILDNACKYSFGRPMIQIKASTGNEHLVISIEDQGCGIPDGEENKIFQPFYRALTPATEGIQGNGLGLSIVHRIVQNHQGEIQLKPNKPSGTIVEIKLPRV